MTERLRPDAWVGDFSVPVDTTLALDVGPLSLTIHRSPMEWMLRHKSDGDLYADTVTLDRREEVRNETADRKEHRFVLAGDSPDLTISVRLPDRGIVSRPLTPLSIPSGETVRLYLSYPLWVVVSAGEPRRQMIEFPSVRLSDTWFGDNTREGVICYATRSRCRLNLADHPNLPNRATTPLVIRNHGDDTLLLDRVRLPVSTLSLYRDGDGRFWSEEVTLTRRADGGLADLELGRGAPAEAPGAARIAEPREVPQRNTLVRAFSALF
ncbi:hypothetical protein [Aquisalimonas asiatica]|uniref:DUF432 domain-containing protein n=1 Tax=Aquisalimonas asiatica TaxID=406100 RepID=A0A1H8VLW5_9GAMM|nr:hypothetical protein [Aquisalimonas asiatica]SEP16303.1 hypothetical protein SAMN04488052_11373 [Aquisalimonas asiatica]